MEGKVSLCRSSVVLSISSDNDCSPSFGEEKGTLSQKEIYNILLSRLWKGKDQFLHLLLFNCLQLKMLLDS